jgi:hypothetical protein
MLCLLVCILPSGHPYRELLSVMPAGSSYEIYLPAAPAPTESSYALCLPVTLYGSSNTICLMPAGGSYIMPAGGSYNKH